MPQTRETSTLDLTREPSGTYALPAQRRTPEGPWGVLGSLDLTCPNWRHICYYTAFQRHDPARQARGDQAIGGGANRVQGLRIERWNETIEGGLFAILQLDDDDWLVLLPIAGPEAMAWLAPTEHGVQLKVGTLGTQAVDAALPALSWARRQNVFAATREAWRQALEATGRGARLREEKPYPELLKYLGWCSWEQHKRGIDEQTIVSAIQRIHQSRQPVRFALIDDGHLRGNGAEKMMDDRLVGLGPNDKFPNGWGPILNERRSDGVRWLALWQNFNGYWGRIASDNDLGDELNAHLMDVPNGGRLPKDSLLDAVAWYEAMIGYAQQSGFDFVKVDQQAANLIGYQGTNNAVRSASHCSQALDRAAAARVNGLINCMAHGPVNTFNTPLGAITRCSEDYVVNDAWRAKAHLHNSYQNMLWLGPTVWGDHDMFHSSDTFAGRMMAVSKAISGGPVYLSDDPDEFDPDLIHPLCDDDGRLLRPLAPAVPLPRSVMVDPFEDGEPYLVAAPLPTGVAAIAAYNLTEPTVPVRGQVTPADHRDAAGLLDTTRYAWPEAEEGLVVYDWYTDTADLLDEAWSFKLNAFEDQLLLLCPLYNGWALIGDTEKYLCPVGIELIEATRDSALIRCDRETQVKMWHNGFFWDLPVDPGLTRVRAR